jgi:hypothetical protein
MQNSDLRKQIAEIIDELSGDRGMRDFSAYQIADRILGLFHDRAVPPEYLEECDCNDWTARLPDMVFQHKPACPKHDPRYELALLADHRHQEVLRQIRALGGDGNA